MHLGTRLDLDAEGGCLCFYLSLKYLNESKKRVKTPPTSNGHGWRGPRVIRLLKVGPATAKVMTSPPPTVGPALSRTGG